MPTTGSEWENAYFFYVLHQHNSVLSVYLFVLRLKQVEDEDDAQAAAAASAEARKVAKEENNEYLFNIKHFSIMF